MQTYSSRFINFWLFTLAIIVLLMIAVGGLTRLTESGLSMVDWKLFMGVIPPISQADWIKLF
jgi:cytochrome c oxidase assembly protein subunit 15